MPKANYLILWPQYFDTKCSRRQGRMVDKKLAVENPTTGEILKAVESLGYVKKVEDGAYPRYWWKKSGKVIVERKVKKTVLLKKVAEKLKSARDSAPTSSQAPAGR